MSSRPQYHPSIRAARPRTQTASQGASSPPSSPSTMRSDSPQPALLNEDLERGTDTNIPSILPTTEAVEHGLYSLERQNLELGDLQRAQKRQFEAMNPLQLHERFLPSSVLQNDSQGPSLHRFMTESAIQQDVRASGILSDHHIAQEDHLLSWYNERRAAIGGPEYDYRHVRAFTPAPVSEDETTQELRQRHRSETYALSVRFRRELNEAHFFAETQEQLQNRHTRELREMNVRHAAEQNAARRQRSQAPSPDLRRNGDDARRRRQRSRAPSPRPALYQPGSDYYRRVYTGIFNFSRYDFSTIALGDQPANRLPGLAYAGSGLRRKENRRPR